VTETTLAMPRLPVRLETDPIIEAVFELRFTSTAKAVADVLQGAIYPGLKDRFSLVERTIISALPSGLLDAEPNLRYQPRLVLRGDQMNVFIGDHAVSLACPKPYLGWKHFKPLILELVRLVKNANVVSEVERFSLRYVNLLQGETPEAQFSLVHYAASLGRRYKLHTLVTYTRTEFEQEGLANIVELGANSVATTHKGESFTGLVVTIDTIHKSPPDFLNNPDPLLEKAHLVEKSVFFEVLTEETVNKMGPIWE